MLRQGARSDANAFDQGQPRYVGWRNGSDEPQKLGCQHCHLILRLSGVYVWVGVCFRHILASCKSAQSTLLRVTRYRIAVFHRANSGSFHRRGSYCSEIPWDCWISPARLVQSWQDSCTCEVRIMLHSIWCDQQGREFSYLQCRNWGVRLQFCQQRRNGHLASEWMIWFRRCW